MKTWKQWTFVAIITLLGIIVGFTACDNGNNDPKTYTVTIGSLTNGSITANPTSGVEGTEITLAVTPDNNYRLKTGTLKYSSTIIDETTKKFNLPAENVTIFAEFELIPPQIFNVTIGTLTNANGCIITASPMSGVEGTEITLTITENNTYRLKAGTLKYGSTTINETTKKFNLTAENVIVTAEFKSPFIGAWNWSDTVQTFFEGFIFAFGGTDGSYWNKGTWTPQGQNAVIVKLTHQGNATVLDDLTEEFDDPNIYEFEYITDSSLNFSSNGGTGEIVEPFQ